MRTEENQSPRSAPSPDWSRLLIENLRDYAIFTLNKQGQIQDWNPGAERILQYTPEEALGQHAALIFTPEDRAAGVPDQEIQTALATGRAEDDRWHQKKDGSRFWASGILTPLFDEDGNNHGFAKILRDLTVQKQTELALRASEERFRAIFGQVEVGILQANLKGMITLVNSKICDVTGCSETELLGKNLLEITHPEDRDRSIAALKHSLAHGTSFEIEKRLLCKDGSAVWVHNGITILPQPDGKPESLLVVALDISERKQFAETLQRANEELEVRVQQRTGELTRALNHLENALSERKMLWGRMTRAQEDERRRISRELHDQTGQHLTALSLGLKTLENASQPDTSIQPLFAHLHVVAQELARDLHRIAVELRPTALDDLGLLPALRAYIEGWQRHNNILVDLEYVGNPTASSPRLPTTVETTVYRVVQEALTNVSRHAPQATQVSITLQNRENWLQVIIEDNGPGFDSDPASRLGRLGIAGMGERAELAGGTLEIESSSATGGATLFLRLPL